MNDCLFCKIIAKTIPSVAVYEDDDTFAFLDINPNNPGHTLVVPKTHTENLYDISDEDFGRMSVVVKKLAIAIKKALSADGINLAMNNERSAGQIIPHTHIHIIPRFQGDGFTHWKGTPYKTGEDAAVAEKIKKEL